MSPDLADHGFTVPSDAPDPNPAAEQAGVDPDTEPNEPEQCAECDNDAHRKQASQIWPDLPDKPLCKSCIKQHV